MSKEKRISTVGGILLLLGLFASVAFLRTNNIFRSEAAKEKKPKDMRVTNITRNSAVVSWFTGSNVSGFLRLNEKEFLDVRDNAGNLGDYVSHYVKISNLDANQRYVFQIFSDGEQYENQDYFFKTVSSSPVIADGGVLASGKVEDSSGGSADGAIVFVSIDGVLPLSSLVTKQGNWMIPLTVDNYQEGEIIEQILVQKGDQIATAVIYTKDDNPVGTIVLGKQYDFTEDQTVANSEALSTPMASATVPTSALKVENFQTRSKKFKIYNPGDGEVVEEFRPEIFGDGPAGGIVEITLESPVKYEAEVDIDETETWKWSPPQDLTPGAHNLTVKFIDPETQEEETFKRVFVLADNDLDMPGFSATPSGSTVAPTVTATPTATIAITPTASPSVTLAPTSPPRKSQPSTEEGVPETGFGAPTAILLFSTILIALIIFGLSF